MITLTLSDDMRIHLARIVSDRMTSLERYIISPWSYWAGNRASKRMELEKATTLFKALTTGTTQ